jgi:hypothetical protein
VTAASRVRCSSQCDESLAGEHRNVAHGDDHIPGDVGKLAERDLHRIAGTQLLLLNRDLHMWCDLGEMGFDLITQVTNHHNYVFWLHGVRGRYRVAQHRVARDLVQQLGTRGLHPLPLACCQDDDSGDRARSLVGVDGQQLTP